MVIGDWCVIENPENGAKVTIQYKSKDADGFRFNQKYSEDDFLVSLVDILNKTYDIRKATKQEIEDENLF